MKRIGIVVLSVVAMLSVTAFWAAAQKPSAPDYKAQLEAALGGKILAVQKTMRYPVSSLTQVLNFTVERVGGRTEIVPVQVVFVKVGDSYIVQSMSLISQSSALAIQRTTQLPKPEPGVGGGGGGGGTGTNAPAPSRFQQCMDTCFAGRNATLLDLARAEACFFACMLGLPIPSK
ncbi:MAG: hypothetical protein H6P96_1076 [Candidatus Aminicenantes bacterium]|nr:hypothetical protein [Candidatus Aminicenantes bacterium]